MPLSPYDIDVRSRRTEGKFCYLRAVAPETTIDAALSLITGSWSAQINHLPAAYNALTGETTFATAITPLEECIVAWLANEFQAMTG